LYDIILLNLPENFCFVELGVWKGRSLSYFTVEAINKNKKGEIVAIDHWLGSEEHLKGGKFYEPLLEQENGLFEHFLDNIQPIKNNVRVIRKTSSDAAFDFEDNSIDAIFIDASHDYQNVKSDLEIWFPKVKKDGMFSGHDYVGPYGVKEAVDEFSKKINIKVNKINRSWYINK
jgi:hypothetical protein